MSIVKNDTVVVISGNSKGKRGQVMEVYPDKQKLLVKGINMVKKHLKPTQKSPQGGIQEKEAPIHLSNVMLWDEKAQKPTRVRLEHLDDEKKTKVRVSIASGEVIETRSDE